MFAPWNWDGLAAFAGAFAAAGAREEQGGDWGLSLEGWLRSLGLPRRQWEGMLLPWVASLFTGRTDQARTFSARAAMIFAATSAPASPTDPVVSYVLNRGMAEPLQRMVKQMKTVEVLTRAEVRQITKQSSTQGFVVKCADGRRAIVDDLVLACSGPSSLRLLDEVPGSGAQQSALAGIEFEATRIALHTDAAYVPQDQNAWSFLNCHAHGPYCEASMWLGKVLAPAAAETPLQLWKSWVTHRDKQPARVLHESNFRHMVPTVSTLQAQDRLRRLQGVNNVWAAGGYIFPFDSQETALLSALDIARGLNVDSIRGRVISAP